MIGWMLDHVPLWVWGLAIAGALVVTIQYWMPIWLALPRPVKAILIALGAIAAAFTAGRRSGKKDADDARRQADANAIQNRSKIDEEVRRAKPDDVDGRLAKWMRD